MKWRKRVIFYIKPHKITAMFSYFNLFLKGTPLVAGFIIINWSRIKFLHNFVKCCYQNTWKQKMRKINPSYLRVKVYNCFFVSTLLNGFWLRKCQEFFLNKKHGQLENCFISTSPLRKLAKTVSFCHYLYKSENSVAVSKSNKLILKAF